MIDLGGFHRLRMGRALHAATLIHFITIGIIAACCITLLAGDAGATEPSVESCHRLSHLALMDSGSIHAERGIDAALGPDGDLYLSGLTYRADLGTPGAFQSVPPLPVTVNSSYSMIARIGPDGTPRFISYLGGSGPYNDTVYRVAVDSRGFAYVIGMAGSLDFPVKNPTGNSVPSNIDTYLMKISPDGGSLVFSTLLGGNGLEIPGAIAINESGEAFVIGSTYSSDFPTLPDDPICEAPVSGGYAFVAKFSSDGQLLFSKRYGPAALWTLSTAIPDASGGVIIGGSTSAATLPPGNAPRPGAATNDFSDGFVAGFDSSGNATFSFYLGGTGSDSITTVLQAPDGDLIVAAESTSAELSGTSAPFAATTNPVPITASISRLSPNGRDIRWTRRLATSEESMITRMAWLPGGSLAALTTLALPQQTEIDPVSRNVLLKLDSSNGSVLSVTEVPSATRAALTLSIKPDGGVRVVGTAVSGVRQSILQLSADPVLCEVTLADPPTELAPTVRWISPNPSIPGTRSLASLKNSLPIKLSVQDWTGLVGQVQLYAGNIFLGAWDSPPFAVSWPNPPVGTHQLRAVLLGRTELPQGLRREWTFSQNYVLQDSVQQDQFTERLPILPEGQSLLGSLLGCTKTPATTSALETCGNSAWFSWSPNQDTTAQCEVASVATPKGQALSLEIYEGDSLNNLSLLTSASSDPPSTRASFQAKAGHTYSLHIAAPLPPTKINYPVNSGSGLFRLTLSRGGAPSNDRQAGATILTGSPALVHGSTEGATSDPDDGNFVFREMTNTVWYSWNAQQTGLVEIRATPEKPGSFYLKVIQPDASTIPDQPSMDRGLIFNAIAGATYSIVIGSGNPGTGFDLHIEPAVAPPTAPILVEGAEWMTRVSTTRIFPPAAQPAPTWQWTAPETGSYQVRAEGEFQSGSLGVKGLGSAQAFKTASSDPNATNAVGANVELVFGAEKGGTYVISFSALTRGVANIHLRPALVHPSNDAFSDATAWPEPSPSVSGNTRGASSESTEPLLAHPQETVWFSWTGVSDAAALISFEADNCLGMVLYQGDTLGTLIPLATNRTDRTLRFRSQPGAHYRLQVSSKCSLGVLDSFALHRRFLSPNDEYTGALAIASISQPLSLDLHNASLSATDPVVTGPSPGSAWWSWAPATDGLFNIKLTGASATPGLLLNRALAKGAPISVLASQKLTNAANHTVESVYSIRSTNVYMLEVFSPCDQPISLVIEPLTQPANDALANRTSLTGLPIGADASMVGATSDIGNPAPPAGLSLWWSWVPPRSGLFRASTAGSEFPANIAVLDGPSLPQVKSRILSPADTLAFTSAYFSADAGREIVLGFFYTPGSGARLHFSVEAVAPAENDSFTNARPLIGAGLDLSDLLVRASYEADEPHPADLFPGGSIWYSWTPPAAGTYYFVTQTASSVSPTVTLYSGNTLAELQPIATAAPSFGNNSSFVALSHSKIFIQAAGMWAASGTPFRCLLQPRSTLANDHFSDSIPLTSNLGQLPTSTVWATQEPTEPPTLQDPRITNTVWFHFTAPSNSTARFSSSKQGSYFSLFEGETLGSLLRVAAAVDTVGSSERTSFAVSAGHTYHLQWSAPPTPDPLLLTWSLLDIPASKPRPGVSLLIAPSTPGGAQGLELWLIEEPGTLNVLELSTDLSNWFPVFTNLSSGTTLKLPTQVSPDQEREFYRLRPQP